MYALIDRLVRLTIGKFDAVDSDVCWWCLTYGQPKGAKGWPTSAKTRNLGRLNYICCSTRCVGGMELVLKAAVENVLGKNLPT